MALIAFCSVAHAAGNSTNTTGDCMNEIDTDAQTACLLKEVAATSSYVAGAIAVAFAICCAVPALCLFCYEGRPECGTGYPIALFSFTYDVFSHIMCWGVYNTLAEVDGVSENILYAVLGLSVVPSLIAFAGFLVGGYLVYNDEDLGDDDYCSGMLLLLSPWKSLFLLYYQGKKGDLNEIDSFIVTLFHCKFLTIDFPLGVICFYVIALYGFNWSCLLKGALELTAIITFWISRCIFPPPYGACGCCSGGSFAGDTAIV